MFAFYDVPSRRFAPGFSHIFVFKVHISFSLDVNSLIFSLLFIEALGFKFSDTEVAFGFQKEIALSKRECIERSIFFCRLWETILGDD